MRMARSLLSGKRQNSDEIPLDPGSFPEICIAGKKMYSSNPSCSLDVNSKIPYDIPLRDSVAWTGNRNYCTECNRDFTSERCDGCFRGNGHCIPKTIAVLAFVGVGAVLCFIGYHFLHYGKYVPAYEEYQFYKAAAENSSKMESPSAITHNIENEQDPDLQQRFEHLKTEIQKETSDQEKKESVGKKETDLDQDKHSQLMETSPEIDSLPTAWARFKKEFEKSLPYIGDKKRNDEYNEVNAAPENSSKSRTSTHIAENERDTALTEYNKFTSLNEAQQAQILKEASEGEKKEIVGNKEKCFGEKNDKVDCQLMNDAERQSKLSNFNEMLYPVKEEDHTFPEHGKFSKKLQPKSTEECNMLNEKLNEIFREAIEKFLLDHVCKLIELKLKESLIALQNNLNKLSELGKMLGEMMEKEMLEKKMLENMLQSNEVNQPEASQGQDESSSKKSDVSDFVQPFIGKESEPRNPPEAFFSYDSTSFVYIPVGSSNEGRRSGGDPNHFSVKYENDTYTYKLLFQDATTAEIPNSITKNETDGNVKSDSSEIEMQARVMVEPGTENQKKYFLFSVIIQGTPRPVFSLSSDDLKWLTGFSSGPLLVAEFHEQPQGSEICANATIYPFINQIIPSHHLQDFIATNVNTVINVIFFLVHKLPNTYSASPFPMPSGDPESLKEPWQFCLYY